LLVENKWPAFVSVSEWFFKPVDKINTAQNNVIKTTSSDDTGNIQLLNDEVDADCEADNMFADATIDIDKTIVMSDHSQGPTKQSADQPIPSHS
jgi:hypothetical protein